MKRVTLTQTQTNRDLHRTVVLPDRKNAKPNPHGVSPLTEDNHFMQSLFRSERGESPPYSDVNSFCF